jgi:Mlc titration factor MtfA (ptsG expression regulator)
MGSCKKDIVAAAQLSVGHDVVLHDFAHQLDSETGITNGAPRLLSRASYQRWSQVFSAEFDALNAAAESGQVGVLNS